MEKIKIGIIGTGTISNYHITAYMKNPNVDVYALCDINETRLNEIGKKYGVTRLYTDKDELLALPELDAASVCVWNSEHAPCAIAALKAGKHVLCEKPMARTVPEAIEMKKVAEECGKALMIGFVRRFGPDCDAAKAFIDAGDLGEIYYAKVRTIRRKGNPGGWFGNKEISGGGPLIDLGVHIIDFVEYITGNPKPVSVYGATFQYLGARKDTKDPIPYVAASAADDDICDVEDMATALVRFDNGLVLSVEAGYSLNTAHSSTMSIELFGSKGGIKLAPNLEYYGIQNGYMTNTQLHSDMALSMSGAFENEVNHFVEVISGKSILRNTPEHGIDLMKILTAIYESADLGHEVMLK